MRSGRVALLLALVLLASTSRGLAFAAPGPSGGIGLDPEAVPAHLAASPTSVEGIPAPRGHDGRMPWTPPGAAAGAPGRLAGHGPCDRRMTPLPGDGALARWAIAHGTGTALT